MLSMNATELAILKNLLESRQPNHGLPRQFYHDELLYRAEMEAIWRGGWLFAGHSCQIPKPGDYFLYDVEGDSVIVVRGDDGRVNALYNVCRHRGSVICQEAQGSVKRFVCPYHQWTYDRSGNLLLQHGMQDGLDKSQLGLHRAHAREVEGLIFISLAEEPVDFDPVEAMIAPEARPQGLARAKIAKVMDFDVASNWKLVWENNRECYHCNVNHPQYIKANFDHYNADDTIPRVAEKLKAVTTRLEAKLAAQGMSVREETGMTPFLDPRQLRPQCDRAPDPPRADPHGHPHDLAGGRQGRGGQGLRPRQDAALLADDRRAGLGDLRQPAARGDLPRLHPRPALHL
jgi:nitrite reductase/ring-hydroxylating ferredoxin subunit